MSDTNIGISAYMRRIHKVITRALEVIVAQGQVFAREGYPDQAVQAGFASYVLSFESILHAHHLTEEELAFPHFREKIPEEPFDLLLVQHSEIAMLVYEIRDLLGSHENPHLDVGSLKELVQVVTKIDQIWHPHIRIEENIFSPEKISRLANAEEQTLLSRQFAEHSQKHSSPDYLVTPFILYNLSPADRLVISQLMPPIVTQQLVPIVWKEKWRPMQPFLLE
jgi:hemerythrin-like domain-containing protein